MNVKTKYILDGILFQESNLKEKKEKKPNNIEAIPSTVWNHPRRVMSGIFII